MPALSSPSVSVVMPVRNEARFIETSLGAMLAQDYDGPMEFIVVDGMSTDGTRRIIEQIQAADPRVRLVDNPKHRTPMALNIGIAAARHALIVRMDGHAVANPDYIRRCVEVRQRRGAANVGGRWRLEAPEGYMGRAIAAAQESPFGAGPATWRHGATETETDTVPFGCFDRQQLLDIGGYDERLTRNQDYELNFRLRAAGGSVVYSPDIVTCYRTRTRLSRLSRQYLDYGYWKARVIRMHPRSTRLRHCAAPLFVVFLMALPLLIALGSPWSEGALVVLAAYGGLCIAFALRQARRRGWDLFLLLPPLFATLHLSWGLGFLGGLARWSLAPGLKPTRRSAE